MLGARQPRRRREDSLLGLQVAVHDAEAVQVVERESQLRQVELHVLLREHHLRTDSDEDGTRGREVRM